MTTANTVIKSRPAVVKIGQSKYFHEKWEDVQKAMTKVLDEAHKEDGNMNDWIDACNEVKTKMDNLHSFGWSVRHGHTRE